MTISKNLDEILKEGERLYLDEFREVLERDHNGDYAVFDVDSGEYVINQNKLTAIEEAQKKFGNKLFYIVRIGYLDKPTVNFRSRNHVSWTF